MNTVHIGSRRLGAGEPVFIIAEAGVNHDGEVDKALALIDAAAQAGADCVKFQTFRAERLVLSSTRKADYQRRNTGTDESQLEMLRRLELPADCLPVLMQRCREKGIHFLSTPYDIEDARMLASLGVEALKLASIHIAEPAFLEAVAGLELPLIVSTGMATLAEVDAGMRALRDAGSTDVVLLQCTTDYPAAVEDANLRAMVSMGSIFDTPVGYSDHIPGNVACIAAVALGACVVEKHMTLDPAAPGPDHAASLDPLAMARLVADLRQTEALLGHAWKRPSPAELGNVPVMRRRLVARRRLEAGEPLVADTIAFMRAAEGLAAAEFTRVLGWRARQPIPEGTPLSWRLLVHEG
jgi:N,N'-diacetyllegionaminate synthase